MFEIYSLLLTPTSYRQSRLIYKQKTLRCPFLTILKINQTHNGKCCLLLTEKRQPQEQLVNFFHFLPIQAHFLEEQVSHVFCKVEYGVVLHSTLKTPAELMATFFPYKDFLPML